MTTLTYPGVYVQEVSSGVRPIEMTSTSTAAFVGLAEMGPEEARRITSWTEFRRYYGSFLTGHYLAHSVYQFFNNGGRQCYIVRVISDDAQSATVTVQNRAQPAKDGLLFSAKTKGDWGNYLVLQIEDGSIDPGNEFKISVRRQVEKDIVPANILDITPLEVHDNLSVDPNAPNYVVTVLSQKSDLIDAHFPKDPQTGNEINDSRQRGIHLGGFRPTLPLSTNLSFQINVDYDGFQLITLDKSVSNSSTLSDIASAIQAAVRGLRATKRKSSTPDVAFESFTCDVDTVAGSGDQLRLQSGTADSDTSSVRIQSAPLNDAAFQLKLGAANGGRSEDGLAVRRPKNANAIQLGDAAIVEPVVSVQLGADGTPPANSVPFVNALSKLDNKTDFSLLAVPGEGSWVMVDAGMSYCQNRPLQDVFYIGDMDQYAVDTQDAEDFRNNLTQPNSYGAVYFPWIQAEDPSRKSAQPILLPPSGYIAGLYASIDASRGVWKAPAGTEARLRGAVGLAADLTDVQHGNLNVRNVNVIRRFATAGIVAYGARTITSDPEWKYVPVRRMAIMLRVSIYNGIQWAVFEPNDEPLWSQLRLNIGSFMMTLFRQGAFQGSTPSQAFFVKCDAETTTQADIDLGIVNILVGFAPLKPAEFVVVKISQKAGQASS